MTGLYYLVQAIAPLWALFAFLALICLCTIGYILIAYFLGEREKQKMLAENDLSDRSALTNFDAENASESEKTSVIRTCLAPDGVDPNLLGYMTIDDGGKEVFLRSLTIDRLPKRVKFAETFASLFNYNNCTTSVYIEPVDEAKMESKLDGHLTTLDAETIAARKKGNQNRVRKLSGQFRETEGWAELVEDGDAKFYKVGFLFTLRADTLEELNRISDFFHKKAVSKGIIVTNCYGMQSESYLSNAPLNERFSCNIGPIKTDGIKMHLMDQNALSTIFNHTQSEFSHRNGIPLGRNLLTGKPMTFDVYDGSHDGYTVLIVGKTGSGKSATIKMMCSRYRVFDYRFTAVDSQAINAVGEYAAIAELMGGVNFQIKADSNNVINIFDVSESTKFITHGTEGREFVTLELKDKIAQVVNTLLTMVQGNREIDDSIKLKFIEGIVKDVTKKLYDRFEIYDGQPESLYREGDVVDEFGNLKIGKRRKELPTLTDYFKLLLVSQKENTKENLNELYDLIVTALKDFVRLVHYSEESLRFFTEEEFEALPVKDGLKVYENNETGKTETVITVSGIRSYFDGQSTVAVSKNCPFTNFDISQLPENEKKLARQIAIEFINESFIKKNSENAKVAGNMVCIFDEAHENFALDYARKTIDNVVRTARKRHVSIWISTQAMREYDLYPETQSILRNAAAKIVFKQDYQDREFLGKALNLTPSQVEMILSLGGNVDDKSGKNARRGECCIIDGSKVAFCHVDYLKKAEAYAVETDLVEVRKLYSESKAS